MNALIVAHTFERVKSDRKQVWDVERLIELAETLPPRQTLVEVFDFDIDPWFAPDEAPTLELMAYHFNRIMESDLSKPIILSPECDVMDGYHRLMKARLFGRKTIKSVQFNELPRPDYEEVAGLTW